MRTEPETGPELVHMRLPARAAGRWAGRRRIDPDDTGYLVHAVTRAALGAAGPQPFTVRKDADAFDVRGYAPPGTGARNLRERLEHGDALAAAAVDPDSIRTEPLPPGIPAGREITFRLDAVPVRRNPRRGEIDAHQPERTGLNGRAAREADYAAWLSERLNADAPDDPCAELLEAVLESFTIREVARSRHARGELSRTRKPAATLAGRLRVLDGRRLIARMRTGVGPHRQFGYGMLLPLRID